MSERALARHTFLATPLGPLCGVHIKLFWTLKPEANAEATISAFLCMYLPPLFFFERGCVNTTHCGIIVAVDNSEP